MFDYNKDDNRRREILADYFHDEGRGGITRFSGVPLSVLQTLLNERFADPDESHNSAPTIDEIRAFMTCWPRVTCHGYFVHIDRDDYRVSIEGVDYKGLPNLDWVMDFVKQFRFADEFVCNPNQLYCWYD